MKIMKNWNKQCEKLLIQGTDFCLRQGYERTSFSISFINNIVNIDVYWEDKTLKVAITETKADLRDKP